MDKKVSIIVPMYNVEKYIERCLSSLNNQTIESYEVICIDDCSPDGSKKNDFAEKEGCNRRNTTM